MSRVSQTLGRVEATFDDDNLIANAGLILPATLCEVLNVEAVINTKIDLRGREGWFQPGRKTLTLMNSMLAGGSHITHADVLRAGSCGQVLSHQVMAPSTIGTFLRAFTFGHVRQLESVNDELLQRAWSLGPIPTAVVVDVDSTICQVHGYKKQGASFGYTKCRCYHPLLATMADTGEVVHGRLRKGSANTQRGTKRFVQESVARCRRVDPARPLTMRFDSGFWSNDTMAELGRLDVRFTMAVKTGNTAIARAIATIDDKAWVPIEYTCDGYAEVAECSYTTGAGKKAVTRRLIVRRTKLADTEQQKLFPDWRHHGFLTDLTGPTIEVDAFHRQHAVVELAIKDLKAGAGLEHLPSGKFSANSAWFQIAILAHNMIRWTAHLGGHHTGRLIVARTIRTQLFAVPARMVNRARKQILRLPTRWPWADTFNQILATLRSIDPIPI